MKFIRKRILAKILLGIIIPVVLTLCLLLYLVLGLVKSDVTDLTNESLSAKSSEASYQVSEFFVKYLQMVDTTAQDPDMETIFQEIVPGVPILDAANYSAVKKSLDNIAALDEENILASWVVDFDSSQLTQSNGYTSGADWDVTTRPWYIGLTAEKNPLFPNRILILVPKLWWSAR